MNEKKHEIKIIKPNGYGDAEKEFIENIKVIFAKELGLLSISNRKLRAIFDNYAFNRTIKENRQFKDDKINDFEVIIRREIKNKENLKAALEILNNLKKSKRPSLKVWKTYNDKEIDEWIDLFEEIGTFHGVSKFIKGKCNGFGPKEDTIKNRVKAKFNERELDFESWLNKYQVKDFYLKNLKRYEEIYSVDDVKHWIEIFEEIGTFSGVSKFIKQKNNGMGPIRDTIRKRIKAKFEEEQHNYDNWLTNYYQPDRGTLIGDCIHPILECIFIEFAIHKGYKAYYEIMPSVYSKKTIIDNTKIDVYCDTKMINIDYTIRGKLYKITNKFLKSYQGEEKLLVIVLLTSDKKNIKLPERILIPYKSHVKLMNANEFAEFIGYRGKYLIDYNYAITLTRRAFYDDKSLNSLIEIANDARIKLEKLSKQFQISQIDLEYFLKYGTTKDFSYLLKESTNRNNLKRFF